MTTTKSPTEKSKFNYYHVPTWLSLGTFIMMAGWLFSAGELKKEFRDGIEYNRNEIKRHESDYNVHMPLQTKFEVFTPRQELDVKFDAMTKQLNRIEAKIDKID